VGAKTIDEGGMGARRGEGEGGGHELVRPVGFVKEVKLKKCGIFDPPFLGPHNYSSSYDCSSSSHLAMHEPTQKVSSIMLYYLAQHARELLYSALQTFSLSKLSQNIESSLTFKAPLLYLLTFVLLRDSCL